MADSSRVQPPRRPFESLPTARNGSIDPTSSLTASSNSRLNATPPITVPSSRGERPYKVLVVGATSSGKSSLIARWIDADSTPPAPSPTPAISIRQKLLEVDGGESLVAIEFWEIPALSFVARYESLYLASLDGAIIVCDCTEMKSFAVILSWQSKLQPLHIPTVLVANKCDSSLSRVAPRMIDESAKVFRCLRGFRVSAVDDIGVNESLMTLLNHIQRQQLGELGELAPSTEPPTPSANESSHGSMPYRRQAKFTPEVSRVVNASQQSAASSATARLRPTQRSASINDPLATMRGKIQKILKHER